jgi:hypothetical protein
MRHVFLSLFAIGLAAVAAIAATTAMLNAPVRTSTVAAIPVNSPTPAAPAGAAAPPASTPEAPKPDDSKPDSAKPAGGAAAPGNAESGKDTKEEEADEDPYAGIAPEELPPDLQYSADSSVSFPTNI